MAAAPVCVNDQLVKTGCYCLNESASGQFTNLFVGDHTLGLRSDSDAQLIIHLAFLQTFKLSSIVFGVPGDGSCPATVKLFANVTNLGFSEAAGKRSGTTAFFVVYFSLCLLLRTRPTTHTADSIDAFRRPCGYGDSEPSGGEMAACRVMYVSERCIGQKWLPLCSLIPTSFVRHSDYLYRGQPRQRHHLPARAARVWYAHTRNQRREHLIWMVSILFQLSSLSVNAPEHYLFLIYWLSFL